MKHIPIGVALVLLPILLDAETPRITLRDRLEAGDFRTVDAALAQRQKAYEAGTIAEADLIASFTDASYVSDRTVATVKEWLRHMPRSYSAHYIAGNFYFLLGRDARGTRYVNDTPPEDLARAERYYDKALPELTTSVKLTGKPLMSLFVLMMICGQRGDTSGSAVLLSYGNRLMPSNVMLRCTHMTHLEPRWGGSYDEMEAFISETQTSCSDPLMPLRLRAIMEDDKGYSAFGSGDLGVEMAHYATALELALKIGPEFRDQWLFHAKKAACTYGNLFKYCPERSESQKPLTH